METIIYCFTSAKMTFSFFMTFSIEMRSYANILTFKIIYLVGLWEIKRTPRRRLVSSNPLWFRDPEIIL